MKPVAIGLGVPILIVVSIGAAVPAGVAALPQTSVDVSRPFVCGEDQRLGAPIALRWSTVVLAGDGRLYQACAGDLTQHPVTHREVREADLLGRGLASLDPDIRWRSAQATARLTGAWYLVGEVRATATVFPACNPRALVLGGLSDQKRWQPGQYFRLLLDENSAVRREAAYAIGARVASEDVNADLVRGATHELRACLLGETQPDVQGLILEALGVARYGTDDERADAEVFIVQRSQGPPARVLGAARGLEALFRQNPKRPVQLAARQRLREMVLSGNRLVEPPLQDVDATIRRVALMALQTAGDWDAATMISAVRDADWQVRRLLAGRLNLSDPEQAGLGAQLANDPAFQVRYDLLTPQARLAVHTGTCAPLIERLRDASPAVAMRAMDVLVGSCTDLDETIAMLADLADRLDRPETYQQWHLAARAFAHLARLRPDLANRAWPPRPGIPSGRCAQRPRPRPCRSRTPR